MIAPVTRLKKREVDYLGSHRCEHGHTYLEHYPCYLKDNPAKDVIGFGDIEASNLTATFGIIYTYCIKKLDGEVIKNSIELKELYNAEYDKRLISDFIKDCDKFSKIVWHYGTDRKFDLPFLRTRAVKFGLPFPEYKFLTVQDTHTILKNKFKLHSNRLQTACDFFDIPSKEHKLNSDIWLLMITGNPKLMRKALDYIMTHNVEDVISLEALWKKIYKYSNSAQTSV